jgi:hypothetical protein
MSELLGPPDQPRKRTAAENEFLDAFNAAQQPPTPARPTVDRPPKLEVIPGHPNDATRDFINAYDRVIVDSAAAEAAAAAVPNLEPAVPETKPEPTPTPAAPDFPGLIPDPDTPAAPDAAAPTPDSNTPPVPNDPAKTHFELVASAKGAAGNPAAGAERQAIAEYEQRLEQRADHWEQIAAASNWATMVAKPSGGNPDLVPGWETGWKGFSFADSGGVDLDLVPKAMEGATRGLRGTAPVDYLIVVPSHTMGKQDKYTYYTFLTRSTNPYDARDNGEPPLAIHFRLPREGVGPDSTSLAFNQALEETPELADRVARRLFATEFESGVVRRATANRLCMIMGKQFANLLDGPETVYTVPASTPDRTRQATSEKLAKTIAWFEAHRNKNYQADGPSTWHAGESGTVIAGRVPEDKSGVEIIDFPYRSVRFPRHGDQPIDERLRQQMQREMPSHWPGRVQ